MRTIARLRELQSVHVYVAMITAVGVGIVGAVAVNGEASIGRDFTEFWIFAALAAVGELLPVRISRMNAGVAVTTSTIFTFALLLRFGVGAAVLAQTIASIISDLASHKPIWKVSFNVSQYALSLAVSGVVLSMLTGTEGLGGIPGFASGEIPAIFVAATVFFLINNSLPRIDMALDAQVPILALLRTDIPPQAPIDGVLLALAPIAVVAGERSLVLIPLLALPMLIIYKGASVYAEKEYKEHQALHDALTALPNRTLFYDRVHQAVLDAKRTQQPVAVMLIDLDRFKEVNDSLGHHVGDLLLKKIGPRLQTLLRESDTIARLGGDEFALVLPRTIDAKAANALAGRILKAMEAPFVLEEVVGELSLSIEASIGIALAPEHGEDVDTLLQKADVAMYMAKEGRNGFEIYAGARDRNSPRQLALFGELRRAIDEHELVFHYQPVAALATGRLVGVEALLRWEHPSRGLVMPDDFIPPAERTGLIKPLTLYSIEMALQQLCEWSRRGLNLRVAANLSRQSLLDSNLPFAIEELFAKWDVPPGLFEIEITESSTMADPARASTILAQLSDLGIRLSLDDFGAGYSSLSYLKRLPVHEIKIDKSFVLGMATDEDDEVIVRSTIDLGRNLGLEVVAEGVETQGVWDRLALLGCDLAQGHFLSPPVPVAVLDEWIHASGHAGDEDSMPLIPSNRSPVPAL